MKKIKIIIASCIIIGIIIFAIVGFYYFIYPELGEINTSVEGIWSDDIHYFEFHNNSTFFVWRTFSTHKEYYGNYAISEKGFIYSIILDYTTDKPWWENPNKEVFDLDFVTVHNPNGTTTRQIEIDGWSYDYYGRVGSFEFSET